MKQTPVSFNENELDFISNPSFLHSIKGGCIDTNPQRKTKSLKDLLEELKQFNYTCAIH